MPWKELSTNKYTRPLDNAELLLKTVAAPFQALDREYWAINVVARVQLDIESLEKTIAALQSAWVSLRYHHPHIAAILDEATLVYQVPDKKALAAWLSESFFVHPNKKTDDFLHSAPWFEYSSLHYFPDSSEIVMRSHHWLVDGIGALHIMNRFFELLSAGDILLSFGDEWKNLQPGLQEGVGISPDSSPENIAEATNMLMQFAGNMPSIGLPIENSHETPGRTFESRLEYPPAILENLLTACRKESWSITSALHAAIVVATQEMATASPTAKNFTTVACFDYRPYMPDPYNSVRMWPMGVYMLGLPTSLSAADFSTQANALQKFYKQPLARNQFPPLEYYDQYTGLMAAALSQLPTTGMPENTTPYLSAIGSIDRRVQEVYEGKKRVVVECVALRTDILIPPIAMYQWSWQGRFVITACYNEVFYKKEFMDKFLGRVESILFQGLGLKSPK